MGEITPEAAERADRRDTAPLIPQVNLFTEAGGFVAAFRDLAMALFKPVKPDVIIWGSRFFKRQTDTQYVECFVYSFVLPHVEVSGPPEFVQLDDDVFILNEETNEIHHKNAARAACQLHAIKAEHFRVSGNLAELRHTAGGDLCGHCFKSKE